MGGALEIRCVGRVYGADGAVRNYYSNTYFNKTSMSTTVYTIIARAHAHKYTEISLYTLRTPTCFAHVAIFREVKHRVFLSYVTYKRRPKALVSFYQTF